jgi:hypothetical protein
MDHGIAATTYTYRSSSFPVLVTLWSVSGGHSRTAKNLNVVQGPEKIPLQRTCGIGLGKVYRHVLPALSPPGLLVDHEGSVE